MVVSDPERGPSRGPREPHAGGARQRSSSARDAARILAVDDEPDLLLALQLYLADEGFAVATASNVPEALRLIAQRQPDLIVTDHIMPGLSGLELCRTLRARPDTRNIPIILHSGWDISQELPTLFDRLVSKPADLDALATLIRSLLAAPA
jgi:two-component system phosphate regulon response regulator PhoB